MNAAQRADKVANILKAIDRFTKAEDDELRELLADFPEVERLVKSSNAFEKKLAKMLREERKYYVEAVQMYLQGESVENVLVGAFLQMNASDMFVASAFSAKVGEAAKAYFTKTVGQLTKDIMNTIDPDVQFKVFDKKTVDWIEAWSPTLGEIMHLRNVDAVEKAIKETLENGESIQTLVLKLQALPEFDRKRARATAITETLTASSVAQHEAYTQSPAVVGKTWRHSGSKKNKPRAHHVKLNGTTIPLDAKFQIDGPTGVYEADYPRDILLPPGERVNCHCVLGPQIDEAILHLTAEERNLIRDTVLSELGRN